MKPAAAHMGTDVLPYLLQDAPALVGRTHELKRIEREVRDAAWVSVVGPGGSGKSRLSFEVAQALRPQPFARVHVVTLAGADEEFALHVVLESLGVVPNPRFDPAVSVARALGTEPVLLVLDGCDRLVGRYGALERLRRAAPAARLLVTSREPLGASDERVVFLPGLAAREADDDAIRLFKHSSRRLAPTATELDPVALRDICTAVGGLPLGVHLAAALLRSRNLAEIARDVTRRRHEGERVEAEVVGFARLLEVFPNAFAEADRVSLRRLAWFRGSFTRHAARAIAGASPRLLDFLVRAGALSRAQGGRLVLHDELRATLRATLDVTECEELERRHANYYLRLLLRIRSPLSSGDPAALNLLKFDREEVIAAARNAVGHRSFGSLAELCRLLMRLFMQWGALRNGIDFYVSLRDEASAARQAGDVDASVLRAERLATLLLGKLTVATGSLAEGSGLVASLLANWSEHTDEDVRFEAELEVAVLEAFQGDAHLGIERVHGLLDRCENRPSSLRLRTLLALGTLNNLITQPDRALPYLERALEEARELGDRVEEAKLLGALSHAYIDRRDYTLARVYAEQGLAAFRALGRRYEECVSLYDLGRLAFLERRYEEALSGLRASVDLRRRIGMFTHEALGVLGRLESHLGRAADADATLRAALDEGRAANARYFLGATSVSLARNLVRAGRTQEALAQLERALEEAKAGEDGSAERECRKLLGDALSALVRPEDAEAAYRAALRAHRGNGESSSLHVLRIALAWACAQREDARAARRFLAEALPALLQGRLDDEPDAAKAYLDAFRVLRFLNDVRAPDVLERGFRDLQRHVTGLGSLEDRTAFLRGTPERRELERLFRASIDARRN